MPSIVICTRDRPMELARCLAALRDHRDAEIIIVDDGSADPHATRELAAAHGAHFIETGGRGLSSARNAGTAVAGRDVVVFLDDDAVPQAGWLDALVAPFGDPLIAATTGRILPLAPGTAAAELFARTGGHDLGPEPRTVTQQTPAWFSLVNFGGVGYGGNMAVRRSVLQEIGGFDELLGLGTPLGGSEENDLFFRVAQRGLALTYVPAAIVLHADPGNLSAVRARHALDLERSTAYLLYLVFTSPRYAPEVLRYALDGVRGRPRTFRGQQQKLSDSLPDRWAAARAGVGRFRATRRLMRSQRAGGR